MLPLSNFPIDRRRRCPLLESRRPILYFDVETRELRGRVEMCTMVGRRTLLPSVQELRSSKVNILPRKSALRQSRTRAPIRQQQQYGTTRWFSSGRSKWREARQQGDGKPVTDRPRSKLFKDADEAVADLQSGSVILSAGFGLCGTAGKPSSRRSQLWRLF